MIDFWFNELGAKDWFRKDDEIDARITQRFRAVHSAAVRGELWSWRSAALGALAEIIVLDQAVGWRHWSWTVTIRLMRINL